MRSTTINIKEDCTSVDDALLAILVLSAPKEDRKVWIETSDIIQKYDENGVSLFFLWLRP